MGNNMLIKKIMGIFLFMWTINLVEGAERQEKPAGGVSPQSLTKSRDAEIIAKEALKEVVTPAGSQLTLSAEETKLLLKRVAELESGFENLKKENAELAGKLTALYDHIGQILTNTPPTFKELITTNKIVWGILLYTGFRFITSGYHAYQTSDYGFLGIAMFYIILNGVEGGADAFIRGYYIGSVLQGLRTLSAAIPKPAAKKQ